MAEQNYKNHAKYYPAHHFVFYPVVLVGIGISVWYYFKYPALHSVWLLLAVIFVLVAWLSFMVRQHYSLTMQDRIIRMEMRFRYYVLTQQRLELLEQQLSFGQIAALRFASDEELPELVKRAIAEKLSPKDIKKSIQHWVADGMRV
jgi:hypothetical protein